MTRTRILFTTAGIIAAALAVQGFVLGLWNEAIGFAGYGLTLGQLISVNLLWTLLIGLLHCAAFGLGIYLSLRYLAPVDELSPWRQTIGRAVIATVAGAIVAFGFSAIVSLIASVTIGAYPFGYSLNGAVDGYKVQYGIQNAVAGALAPLVGWLPITVLGIVLFRLWIAAHPTGVAAIGRASVSA